MLPTPPNQAQSSLSPMAMSQDPQKQNGFEQPNPDQSVNRFSLKSIFNIRSLYIIEFFFFLILNKIF